MITRLLPRDEWDRLVETELGPAVPYFPTDTRVIVVEGHGDVLGAWSMPRYLHAECLWTHPTVRHTREGVAVLRQLETRLHHEAAQSRDAVVLTTALTPDVAALCARVGGQPLPGTTYVLPMGGR